MIHRLARQTGKYRSPSGKRLCLCGNYVRRGSFTIDPNEVTCKTCIVASTSQRTIARDRLATSIDETPLARASRIVSEEQDAADQCPTCGGTRSVGEQRPGWGRSVRSCPDCTAENVEERE